MALTKQIMGSSLLERSLFVPSSPSSLFNQTRFLVPLESKRVLRVRKAAKFPVATISEDLVKGSSSSSSSSSSSPASSSTSLVSTEKPVKFKVRAVITVRNKIKEDLKETIVKHIDALADKIGRNVVLELVSTEIDPKTKAAKKSTEAVLKDWSKKSNLKVERVNYTAEFIVDSNFGEPGAITVTNKHQKEFFLESITIEGFATGPVHFPCNSWVQARKDHPGKRIFFSNKPYLPGDTPAGLRLLREKELRNLRGDGKGVRNLSDRIYDYDIYNDLGNPDKGIEYARPNLGGSDMYPYPRRCRTGREPSDTDMYAESRVEKPLPMYVPRDERFEESKQNTFTVKRLKAVLHNLIPGLKASLSASNQDFNEFSDVDGLYSEGLLIKLGLQDDVLKKIPFVSKIQESSQGLLKYDTPKIISSE